MCGWVIDPLFSLSTPTWKRTPRPLSSTIWIAPDRKLRPLAELMVGIQSQNSNGESVFVFQSSLPLGGFRFVFGFYSFIWKYEAWHTADKDCCHPLLSPLDDGSIQLSSVQEWAHQMAPLYFHAYHFILLINYTHFTNIKNHWMIFPMGQG